MKLKSVLLSTEDFLLEQDNSILKEITSTAAYIPKTPPLGEKPGKTFFYDFYAMDNLYATIALDESIMKTVPNRVWDKIENMYKQVVLHVGNELVRYLMWATVLEMQHFNGHTTFSHFISQLKSHPRPMTHDAFETIRREKLPDVSFDIAVKLLYFHAYYYGSGINFVISIMSDMDIPHPTKKITPSVHITGLEDPTPKDVDKQKEKDVPLLQKALQKWKWPADWDAPPSTTDEPEEPSEPIDPPPEQDSDPDYDDPDHWVNKWIKKQGLDEIITESERLDPPRIRKLWNAFQKAGMDFRDVQDAFNNVPWTGSYGDKKWGEAVKSGIQLRWLLLFKTHDLRQIAASIDRVYDLQHHTGMILNKGKMEVFEPDLDRRAQTKHAIHFLSYVSPSVRKVLQMGIGYIPVTHEQSAIMQKTQTPGIKGTPVQEKLLADLGFRWHEDSQSYHATIDWTNKRGSQVTNYYYIVKIFEDGSVSLNNNLKSNFELFPNVDTAFKEISQLDPKINKYQTPAYTSGEAYVTVQSEKEKYLQNNSKIKLSPEQEAKLKEYQFGWRPSSERYRAESKTGDHYYLYAFQNGKFLYTQKNTQKYKLLDTFDEAIATIANLTMGKVNPLKPAEGESPSSPQASVPPIQGQIGQPQSITGGEKKYGFSHSEYNALEGLIATNFKDLSYMQWEIDTQENGKINIQQNSHGSILIMFRVGKALPVGSFGKPFVLNHYHGYQGKEETFYFHTWQDLESFIVSHADLLAKKDPIGGGIGTTGLPPHSLTVQSYSVGGSPKPIRLTILDESDIVAAGFVPKLGGKFVFYLHEGTNDVIRFFSNNTATIHFSVKGGTPLVNFKSIAKAFEFIKTKYNKYTSVSPAMGTPSLKSSTPSKPSVKVGLLMSPKLKKAGFGWWDEESSSYLDKSKGTSLKIFQDRTSILTFGDGSTGKFKDYPDLLSYLSSGGYAKDAESKKGKGTESPVSSGLITPILKPEAMEEFVNLITPLGFTYEGTGMPSVEGESWLYEDDDGNRLWLGLYGDVKFISAIGEVLKLGKFDEDTFQTWLSQWSQTADATAEEYFFIHEKKWLVDELPKLSPQTLKVVPNVTKSYIYYTTFNVMLFEIGKNNQKYFLNQTTTGQQSYTEFQTFDELKNYVIDNIEKLSIGEKASVLPPDVPPPTLYAPPDVTKELNKAEFKYHGPTEDHNGDLFKHPVKSSVVYWDDGHLSYYSSNKTNAHTELFNSYNDFKNAVLLNKAYVYYNALMGEQYTKHYYDDVAPAQNVYSIRLTEQDEKIIKKHGFEWVPTSKTHQTNRYQRQNVHVLFYNKSITSSEGIAADIFKADESGPDKGKLGTFKTVDDAIGWIIKNFPEEGDSGPGGGEGPFTAPTDPATSPTTEKVTPLTEKQKAWLGQMVPQLSQADLVVDGGEHAFAFTTKSTIKGKGTKAFYVGRDVNGFFLQNNYNISTDKYDIKAETIRFDSFSDLQNFIIDNIVALVATHEKLSKDDESIPSIPPTTPSDNINELSDSETNAVEKIAKFYGLEAKGSSSGMVIQLGNTPKYILNKENSEYKIRFKPIQSKKWVELTSLYSLVKNDHITDFAEVYKYLGQALKNIAKDAGLSSTKEVKLASKPSGQTYDTEQNAANASLVKLNEHDEALLASEGFKWKPEHNHYYVNENGDVFKAYSNGMANYSEFNDTRDFDSIPVALAWIAESDYDVFAEDPLEKSVFNTLSPGGIKFLAAERIGFLAKHDYFWRPKIKAYYNAELDQVVVLNLAGIINLYREGGEHIPMANWKALQNFITGQSFADQQYKAVIQGGVKHSYYTIDKDKVQKVVKLQPNDEEKLEAIGFKFDDSFGYPAYIKDNITFAAYNDDTAHVQNLPGEAEDIYFEKDGSVIGGGKKAPYSKNKSGVHNAIETLIKKYSGDESDLDYSELASMMVKFVKSETDIAKDFGSQKIKAIKALREFYYSETSKKASLLHAKMAIENWSKFISYVEKNGLPQLWSDNQGAIDVWLNNAPDGEEHDSTLAKETEEQMNNIGFEYKGMNDIDLEGSPIVTYENPDGDTLNIKDNGEVSYYVKVGGELKWTGGWETVEDAINDFQEGKTPDKASHTFSPMPFSLPPFSEGTPEDKTLKDAGFKKGIVPNSYIAIYNHPDGTSVQIHPPNDDKHVPMQAIVYSQTKAKSKSFAFNDPKKTIELVIKWVSDNYPKSKSETPKPPYPTKAEGNYNFSHYTNYTFIKLQGKDHELMEEMGFELIYDTSPVYEKGQLQVRFGSHDDATFLIGDKTKSKFTSKDGGILAALQRLWRDTWGEPTEQSSIEENQLKAMGFKQFGSKAGTGITYLKTDNEYLHTVDIRYQDKMLEYTKAPNKFGITKILENWTLPVEEGIAKLQTKLTSHTPSTEPAEATDLTTGRLQKLGYSYVGKDANGNYFYTKTHDDEKHGKLFYQIELSPWGIKHSISMKNKDGKYSPMTEHEWPHIEQGLKQIELWEKEDKVEPEKSSAAQGEMPYSEFNYTKWYLENQNINPSYSVWLTPPDADVLKKLGFKEHIVPAGGPIMQNAYARGDERMIFFAGGNAKYFPNEKGYTHQFDSFKEAMQFLWNKHKKSQKPTQVPYSGKDYTDPDGINTPVRLNKKDEAIMKSMGFEWVKKTQSYYKPISSTTELNFEVLDNGKSTLRTWITHDPNDPTAVSGSDPEKFGSVQQGMQFLWDMYGGDSSSSQESAPIGMPYSDTDYVKRSKELNIHPEESIQLTLNEALLLKDMGFLEKKGTSYFASMQNKTNDQIYYQKGFDGDPNKETVQFYAKGSAHYWDTKKAKDAFKKFSTIKEAFEYLWKKHKKSSPEQMELPGTKTKMPFSGYDYYGKGIDQGLSNKESIILHPQDTKVMKSIGFEEMSDKTIYPKVFYTKYEERIIFYGDGIAKYWEFGFGSDAEIPTKKFTNVRDAMQFLWNKHYKNDENLFDYQEYPYPEEHYDPDTGGYKEGVKMKLRIKDNEAILSKQFEYISDPNSDEVNEYHHPNGDWFFITSNGLMTYKLRFLSGSLSATKTIKEGFARLKQIYFMDGNSPIKKIKESTFKSFMKEWLAV